MRHTIYILIIWVAGWFGVNGQPADTADFCWGNGCYYNLDVGESIRFQQKEIKLLNVFNHYNQLKIGEDTLWLKVARRSVPLETGDVRIFVADNRTVQAMASDRKVHGLLTGDALVCLSDVRKPLLDPGTFVFPVSFNDGFSWQAEEESYTFSWYNRDATGRKPQYESYPGVGLDMHDARKEMKHWLVAMENSRVVWVEKCGPDASAVLLRSASQPDIYYCYSKLNSKTVAVKKDQELVRGEVIGTAWGDAEWEHMQFIVVRAESDPVLQDCPHHAVNGFPQLLSLYSPFGKYVVRSFSRGRITFGFPRSVHGNRKNTMAFEGYAGKGWCLGRWCPADQVEWVAGENTGNARLGKVMFRGTPAQCENPSGYFDYRINVQNGTYRIRAKVGDHYLPTWQKLEFNGVPVAATSLTAGKREWTGERIIHVTDRKIIVRIRVDEAEGLAAGLEEIVFQRAY